MELCRLHLLGSRAWLLYLLVACECRLDLVFRILLVLFLVGLGVGWQGDFLPVAGGMLHEPLPAL